MLLTPHLHNQLMNACEDPHCAKTLMQTSTSKMAVGLRFQHVSFARSEPLKQAADGIREALGAELVNCAEVAGYVDTLLATPSPFEEAKLGGGPWQVPPPPPPPPGRARARAGYKGACRGGGGGGGRQILEVGQQRARINPTTGLQTWHCKTAAAFVVPDASVGGNPPCRSSTRAAPCYGRYGVHPEQLPTSTIWSAPPPRPA